MKNERKVYIQNQISDIIGLKQKFISLFVSHLYLKKIFLKNLTIISFDRAYFHL